MTEGKGPAPTEQDVMIDSGAARVFVRVRHIPSTVTGVILVHGLGDHSGRLERVAESLNEAGLSTWAMDLRGHGRSDGRRGVVHSFDELLDDIDSVRRVAGQAGVVHQFVLGHSMGGLAALRYAQTRRSQPVSGIVAVAPFSAVRMPIPTWKRVTGRWADRLLPALALDNGIAEEDLFRTSKERERHAGDPLVHRRISARLWHEMLRHAGALVEESAIGVPVLFQVPGDDRVVDSATTEALIRARFPDADVRGYDGAYHDLYFDPVADQAIGDAVHWIETIATVAPVPGTETMDT